LDVARGQPAEPHIGLGQADPVALLESHWPTSGTTQVFHDLAVNQGIVATELATDYCRQTWLPIALRHPVQGNEQR
jgi:ASPIC and UnbV